MFREIESTCLKRKNNRGVVGARVFLVHIPKSRWYSNHICHGKFSHVNTQPRPPVVALTDTYTLTRARTHMHMHRRWTRSPLCNCSRQSPVPEKSECPLVLLVLQLHHVYLVSFFVSVNPEVVSDNSVSEDQIDDQPKSRMMNSTWW